MKIFKYISVLYVLFLVSCVPSRDLIYLQQDGKNEASQPVNPVALKPYRLQVNDILYISIRAIDPSIVEMFNSASQQNIQSENTLYFNGYTVDDHGNIRMPILEEVNVIGLTLEEARQKIEKRLLEEFFTKEAHLYVTVKLAGFRYTINGEVGHPGTITLMQEKVNIMEAVANAGDITVTGDRKNVVVIRQLPHGTEMHTIDLTDVKAMQSPFYYLQPNDYIYVKPLPQKSWGTGTTGIQSITTVISVLTLITTTILIFVR